MSVFCLKKSSFAKERLFSLRKIAVVSSVVFLCSCEGAPLSGIDPPLGLAKIPGIVAIDAVTLINTDKTLMDHMMTAASGKDCSTVKAQDGSPYCKDFPYKPPVQQEAPKHCYRTLGEVSCYSVENPYGTDTEVGSK